MCSAVSVFPIWNCLPDDLVDAATASPPLDMVMEKAIRQATGGAAPENAALIVASLAYLTGSCDDPASRWETGSSGLLPVCMPAHHAPVPSPLLTGKFTHKIPAFPAYLAVYNLLMDKKLTLGRRGCASPLHRRRGTDGHSALGEDINIPEMARNTAKAGTRSDD